MEKPLILITNDDGYGSRGLEALISFVRPLGEIWCVCPACQHSGQSMAMTINNPLLVRRQPDLDGVPVFTVEGTPVDCVKMSLLNILPRRPDMVLAGINHGSNASINVLYSGTMGAVMEGCQDGLPAIGYSLTDHDPHADFSHCRRYVEAITAGVLKHGLPRDMCLNVNIPAGVVPAGMRVTRGCRCRWSDEYRHYESPYGQPFYWLSGEFLNSEPHCGDTDQYCLDHGYVSVVPVTIERTAPRSLWPEWLTGLESDERRENKKGI